MVITVGVGAAEMGLGCSLREGRPVLAMTVGYSDVFVDTESK